MLRSIPRVDRRNFPPLRFELGLAVLKVALPETCSFSTARLAIQPHCKMLVFHFSNRPKLRILNGTKIENCKGRHTQVDIVIMK